MGLIAFLIGWPIFIDWYIDDDKEAPRPEPADNDRDRMLDNVVHPIAVLWFMILNMGFWLVLQYVLVWLP